MTEAEWLVCDDPGNLLTYLEGKGSERQLRLFAIACCRDVWSFLVDERSKEAMESLERHADGPLPAEDWEVARRNARLGFQAAMTPQCKDAQSPRNPACAAAMAVWHATPPNPTEAAGRAGYQSANAARRAPNADFIRTFAQACHLQTHFVRDIFGNPFRPVSFSPAWQTDTALTLARQMYDSRDFSLMPILADALQDAGCEDEHILSHCRDPQAAHVRGCWVVDLVLGKV